MDEADTVIDIGALRALKDLVADIEGKYIPEEPLIRQEQVDNIRENAGADKVPMLILYRIDKDSKKRESSDDRLDLDFACDIIGMQICVPGDQVNRNFCKRLTIQLPDRDREDEVEEIP